MAARKRLRRRAEQDHPGRLLGWRGGRLYFLDTEGEVEGALHIPKPNREAVGWERLATPAESRKRRSADDHRGDLNDQRWWRLGFAQGRRP